MFLTIGLVAIGLCILPVVLALVSRERKYFWWAGVEATIGITYLILPATLEPMTGRVVALIAPALIGGLCGSGIISAFYWVINRQARS